MHCSSESLFQKSLESLVKKYLIATLICLASGCTTAPKPESVAPIVSDVLKDGCFSVFSFGTQLAIVTSYGNEGYLIVYNPENGLFISRSLYRRVICWQVNIDAAIASWAHSDTEVYLVDHPFARKTLDNARTNTEDIKKLINWNAPSFRRLDILTPHNVTRDLEMTVRITNETRPENVLMTYSPADVRSIVRALNESKTLQNRQIAVRSEAHANAKKKAMKPWVERAKAHYAVGDRVCTYEGNFFGNIETITTDKFKLHVIGRSVASNGFFFSPDEFPFTPEMIEAPRWFNKDEVAHCKFKQK